MVQCCPSDAGGIPIRGDDGSGGAFLRCIKGIHRPEQRINVFFDATFFHQKQEFAFAWTKCIFPFVVLICEAAVLEPGVVLRHNPR